MEWRRTWSWRYHWWKHRLYLFPVPKIRKICLVINPIVAFKPKLSGIKIPLRNPQNHIFVQSASICRKATREKIQHETDLRGIECKCYQVKMTSAESLALHYFIALIKQSHCRQSRKVTSDFVLLAVWQRCIILGRNIKLSIHS